MNTSLREAIARRKNPEKYNFEQLQIQLEKQRADSLKEMLSLSPIIEYLKGIVKELVSSYLEEIKPELARIREEVKKVASQKQSGGGGMGNLQHESKAVSSGTTSVNTTYTVAGGGYAIWAYYQGQLIMRGVHYTVSGKTITLLFTPEDNTTIDVIYHR